MKKCSICSDDKNNIRKLLVNAWDFIISPQGIACNTAFFLGLLFVQLENQLHRNFYYLFVLVPFLLVAIRHPPRELLRTTTFRLTMFFFVYFSLSLFWGTGVSGEVIFDVIRKELMITSFILLIAWLDRREYVLYLLIGMAIGAVFSSCIALYLYYIVESHTLGERLIGLGKGGHPIKSATIYGVALIILFSYPYKMRLNKIFLLIVSVSSMVFILLAQSRGVVLTLLAVYIVALILTKKTKQLIGVAVVLIGLITCVYLGGNMGRYSSLEFVRYGIWMQAFAQAGESLVFGYGIYPEQAITVPSSGTVYVHPHNVFVSHLLYGGVPGLLVLVLLVGSLVRSSWRAWVRDGNVMLILLLVYFIGCGSFDYSTLIRSAGVEWLLFWLAVGFVVAYEARKNLRAELG